MRNKLMLYLIFHSTIIYYHFIDTNVYWFYHSSAWVMICHQLDLILWSLINILSKFGMVYTSIGICAPYTLYIIKFEFRFQVRDPESSVTMMTSSNGNIFRVTGPLCGEFTGPGEFPTQRPVTRSFDVFFDLGLNKRLSKHEAGDLRRYRSHYDVIVMLFKCTRTCDKYTLLSTIHRDRVTKRLCETMFG